MKVVFMRSFFYVCILSTLVFGCGKVDEAGLTVMGEGASSVKSSLSDEDIEGWTKLPLRREDIQHISGLTGYDSAKDPFVFCGTKNGRAHCVQYILSVENTSIVGSGYRRGNVDSRELIELEIPSEVKNPKYIFTKGIGGNYYADIFFCAQGDIETCWTYGAEWHAEKGARICADRNKKFKSLRYSMVLYPKINNVCFGPFVSKDGFNYHFYNGLNTEEGKQTVNIERCTLNRRVDTSFGNQGHLLVEVPGTIKYIDIVTKASDGILIGSTEVFEPIVFVHKIDFDFNFVKDFSTTSYLFPRVGTTRSDAVFTELSENADHSIKYSVRLTQGLDTYSEVNGTISRKGGSKPKWEIIEDIPCMLNYR